MPLDAASYDDEQELTAYVWHNYRNLLTPLESLTDKTLLAESKARHASGKISTLLRQRWSNVDNPDVEAALADGPNAFRKRVRERIIEECAQQITVNRCPSCSRVVATPKARQCLWCGHDWH